MKIDNYTRRNGPPIQSISNVPLPKFLHFKLDNGLPVYYIRQGSQELVKLDIVFKGGRHREKAKSISKIFSSVIKEGTLHDDAESLSAFFDMYGASYNSRSSLDYTTFTIMSLSKFFPRLIQKFSEIILEPAFSETEIQKSIQNHCRKLELNNSKNEIIAYRQLTEHLFGTDEVYGYNSSEASYTGIKKEMLQDFHKDMLEQQDCSLFLCGQYNEDVEKAINKAFGQWSYKGGAEILYTKSDTPSHKRFNYPSAQDHQSAIRIARKFGNRKDKAYAQMSFLNNVLGGFFGSRLMKNIREEKGYTYNIFTSLDTMLYEGYFYVSTDVSPKYLDDTITEIYKEMEALRATKISKEELEMNRNYLLGNLLTAVDGPFQSIRIVKSAILNNESEEDLAKTIDVFMHISAEELQKTAEMFLDPTDFIEVIIG